jgi:hypothetical protein
MSTENIRKRSNSEKDSKNASSDIVRTSDHVNDEHCNEKLDFFDFIEAMTDEMDTIASKSKSKTDSIDEI